MKRITLVALLLCMLLSLFGCGAAKEAAPAEVKAPEAAADSTPAEEAAPVDTAPEPAPEKAPAPEFDSRLV